MECLKLLIQNSPGNKSKEFSTMYLKINDSINNVRLKAKNQFAKIKYDSKKEKDENIKLKASAKASAQRLAEGIKTLVVDKLFALLK